MNHARSRRLVPAALAAALLLGPWASPSTATNFGSQGTAGVNGVWLTPTYDWQVGRRDLTSTNSTAVYNAVKDEYEPTDLLTTVYSPTSCLAAYYDVCVFDWDYGDNGVYGWNDCIGTTSGSHPNQVCSLDYVRLNLYYTPVSHKHLACHELGHSVGLRHTSDTSSCLVSTAWPEDTTTHDRAHLNAQY